MKHINLLFTHRQFELEKMPSCVTVLPMFVLSSSRQLFDEVYFSLLFLPIYVAHVLAINWRGLVNPLSFGISVVLCCFGEHLLSFSTVLLVSPFDNWFHTFSTFLCCSLLGNNFNKWDLLFAQVTSVVSFLGSFLLLSIVQMFFLFFIQTTTTR